MRRELDLAGLVAGLLCCGASAASAQGAPGQDWTGPYVGLALGGGGRSDQFGFVPEAASPLGLPSPGNLRASNGRLPLSADSSGGGVAGGVVAGYNYQLTPGSGLVVGVAAAALGSSISGTQSTVSTRGDVSRFETSTPFVGTVQGRVGYAIDNVMVYGSAGLGVTQSRTAATFYSSTPATPVVYAGSTSGLQAGAAFGGGVEVRLPPSGFGNATIALDGTVVRPQSFNWLSQPQAPGLPSGVTYKDNSTVLIGTIRTTFTF